MVSSLTEKSDYKCIGLLSVNYDTVLKFVQRNFSNSDENVNLAYCHDLVSITMIKKERPVKSKTSIVSSLKLRPFFH